MAASKGQSKKSKAGKSKQGKSWQGRLGAQTDAAAAALVSSLDVDVALWKHDIAGSVAHAKMLSEIGIISKREFGQIEKGLSDIGRDIEAGKLPMSVELEDIHMVIEKALIDRIGEAGKKLHTGRSRNDQIALDLRLWAREAVDKLITKIAGLQKAFVTLAEKFGQIVMPAYTHLQRAQPIAAGHALLAYVEMLQRDADRLADARKRINVCPLGSGAVAGTSIPLDRSRTAQLLGFAEISNNSIDATADRDFLAELCFGCAQLAVHLSRWAEDWIIYSTMEFGTIILCDAYCTSSSMMPQKKNADTLELIRAKSASAIAALVGTLTLLKGLPLAYNRDLQDDKRFALPAVEAMLQSLTVAAGVVATSQFNESHIHSTINRGFLDATSLAEYLVNRGVPFRQAHQMVGELVATAEKKGKTLGELSFEELLNACQNKAGPDVYEFLGAANVVNNYAPQGEGGLKQFNKQLAAWQKRLG